MSEVKQDVALGLDLGTSGVRILAVTTDGKTVAEINRSYPLLTPQPGWTEQNPSDWKQESLLALKEMVAKLGTHYSITALGLSGQMHGMVPLDAQGEVIRPALLWNDQRTGDAVKAMEAKVSRETFIQSTGNPAITGFHAPKIVWMQEAEPENFSKLRHSLLPKDYLGYILTGEMVAEPSDASGSNCFNLAKKEWDADILNALGIDPSIFPNVIASHEQTGTLTAEMAKATDLPEGLPIIAGGGDNAAAAIGLGLSSSDTTLGTLSLGTSGVIFAPLTEAKPDPEGRVHLFCHADGGYNLLGVTLSAAGSFQWYHDTFAPDHSFDYLTELASTSEIGSHGVSFKPYLSGERTPHMNPDLRGSWTGLSLATNQADVVRSVLEGVAFSMADALDVISNLTTLTSCLTAGGGAESDMWLQMTSDVLGIRLERLSQNQGAAYGAALLAMQGIGVTDSAIKLAQRDTEKIFEAIVDNDYKEALTNYRSN